jgi:hypothetical protein
MLRLRANVRLNEAVNQAPTGIGAFLISVLGALVFVRDVVSHWVFLRPLIILFFFSRETFFQTLVYVA